MSYISVKHVSKIYNSKFNTVQALKDVSFSVEKNEFVVILGASGAGKTTLLNLLGGMDSCSSGEIIVKDNCISNYSSKQLVEYRRNSIGFVFQFYNLIGNLTALENVELATQICKNPLNPEDVLKKVGLGHRLHNFPSELSGGEQQRVSIARALAKNPAILLCDEPTGALDVHTGIQVLKLLQQAVVDFDMTIILITHNQLIAQMADKVIHVRDGEIKECYQNIDKKQVEDIQW